VTPAGRELLDAARPTNNAALREALDAAAADPQLAPLVAAVAEIPGPGGTESRSEPQAEPPIEPQSGPRPFRSLRSARAAAV
jgi:hypothetical protein